MIPLNLVETITRTFSLVVRLFGNVMSGVFVVGIVLSLVGLLVPVPLMALDLLTGAVQAYIFSVLAMVFISGVLGQPIGNAPQSKPTELPAMNWIQIASIIGAALAVSFGAIGPALGEGRAVAAAMDAIARQPEAADTLSRTLFVGLAMIETMAIYCLVIALLLLFANPFIALMRLRLVHADPADHQRPCVALAAAALPVPAGRRHHRRAEGCGGEAACGGSDGATGGTSQCGAGGAA